MSKPTRIKLKRDQRVELGLRKSDSNKMIHLYLNGCEIGGKDLIGLICGNNHARINTGRASRVSMAVTDGEYSCTIVIRVEE